MHDGDKKEVTYQKSATSPNAAQLTVKPSGNNESWTVSAVLNEFCQARVDFNVPGKPNPPPFALTATLWIGVSYTGERKIEWEFTDPSDRLQRPLNRWVQLDHKLPPLQPAACITSLKKVFSDMHDGDKKEVTVTGTHMTIKPSGNNQTWVVNAVVDPKSCSAVVDFNVPGKPNPPPVNLTATLMGAHSAEMATEIELQFTDPTGTLADKDYPLNSWTVVAFGRSKESSILV